MQEWMKKCMAVLSDYLIKIHPKYFTKFLTASKTGDGQQMRPLVPTNAMFCNPIQFILSCIFPTYQQLPWHNHHQQQHHRTHHRLYHHYASSSTTFLLRASSSTTFYFFFHEPRFPVKSSII